MSKKSMKNQDTSSDVKKSAEKEVLAEDAKVSKITDVKQKKQKETKKKSKKPNVAIKKLKETGSELKKVNWPDFPKVVKKTGIVIAVVIIFAAVIFGIDRFLSWIFDLLTSSIS